MHARAAWIVPWCASAHVCVYSDLEACIHGYFQVDMIEFRHDPAQLNKKRAHRGAPFIYLNLLVTS
jgi:hypothetical protein